MIPQLVGNLSSGIDQCNDCEAGRCKLCDAYRFSDGRIAAEPFEIKMMLDGTCLRRVKPKAFRRPLVEFAMYHNAQSVYEVLSAFGMRLIEYENRQGVKVGRKPKRKKKKGKKKGGRSNTTRTITRHQRSNISAKN